MWTPPTKHEYDVHNLPDRINFLKSTQDLPLPRGAKSKFQLYISSMNKKKLKETIVNLEIMMNEAMTKAKVGIRNDNIVIPEKIVDQDRKKWVWKAIYTKAVYDFAKKYLTSLEYQKKI